LNHAPDPSRVVPRERSSGVRRAVVRLAALPCHRELALPRTQPHLHRLRLAPRRRGWPIAALLAAIAVSACDGAVLDPGRDMSITVLPAAGLVQPMRIQFPRPRAVTLDYWTTDGPRLRVTSAADRAHDLLLTRLRPDRTYRYEVVGTGVEGAFRSAPLPADLVAVDVQVSGSATQPLVLLHFFADEGFRGYVVVDPTGSIVWYWRTADFPFGATRRANGNFVFMDKGRGLVEVTADGAVVSELAQDVAAREMHHDAIATPANTILFLAFDERTVDGQRVLGEAIWEWTPETGAAAQRWSSWDHLSLTADRGPRFGLEWMHANALALGSRGNVLLSTHYLNQVLSLSPDLASIEWRLGGVNATVTVDGTAFTGQHTPTEIAPGRVLLFDNALERGGPSRALELDIGAAVATPRWVWTAPNGNFASAVSSARRLANGHTLIAFGMASGVNGSSGPTEVYEVDRDGAFVWRLEVAGPRVMFRAEPLNAIAAETVIAR
jgi:Arylsulfotransferase (ASST)